MKKPRLAIITAHHAEAKPIIKYLGLKKTQENTYSNEQYILMISGQGIIFAASSIGKLFAQNSDIYALLNFGVAGGHDAISTFTLIDSISFFDKKDYVPAPFRHSFKKQHLETKLQASTDYKKDIIFDMEGWGIYQAARHYLDKDYLFFAKVISDNHTTTFNKAIVNDIIEKNLIHIETLIGKINSIIDHKKLPTSKTLEKYKTQFHCSAYQSHEIQALLARLQTLDLKAPTTSNSAQELINTMNRMLKKTTLRL